MAAIEQKIQVGSFIIESVNDALTAAGTTQAGAFVLGSAVSGAELNRFTTVAASSGCMLPPATPGFSIIVANSGANALTVYGNGGDTVNGAVATTGIQLQPNQFMEFICLTAGVWWVFGPEGQLNVQNTRGGSIGLNTQVAAFSSANTNTSQTMFTFSVPAGTLSVAGNGLYVETWGTTAANAAPKSITLNIGGQKVNTGTFTTSASAWSLDAYVFKTGASAQTMLFEGWAGSSRVTSAVGTDTSVDTSAISITVVATDASAASANVLGNGIIVQFLP
jgi:hypothetical protein